MRKSASVLRSSALSQSKMRSVGLAGIVERVLGRVDKSTQVRQPGRLEADPEPMPQAVVMTKLVRVSRVGKR